MQMVLYKYQNYIDKCFSSLLLKPETDLSGRDLRKERKKAILLSLGGGYIFKVWLKLIMKTLI